MESVAQYEPEMGGGTSDDLNTVADTSESQVLWRCGQGIVLPSTGGREHGEEEVVSAVVVSGC